MNKRLTQAAIVFVVAIVLAVLTGQYEHNAVLRMIFGFSYIGAFITTIALVVASAQDI